MEHKSNDNYIVIWPTTSPDQRCPRAKSCAQCDDWVRTGPANGTCYGGTPQPQIVLDYSKDMQS